MTYLAELFRQVAGSLLRNKLRSFLTMAGICGLTAARKLAEAGKRVLVIERSNQIGGLCKEGHYRGTRFSIFGPHIFHTDDEEVWKFLSKFTEWTYFNSAVYVKSFCKGRLWSIPIDNSEVTSEFHELLLKSYLYDDYNRKRKDLT